MAEDREPITGADQWRNTADLLVSELGSNESSSSVQAARRLFDTWETQLIETLHRKQGGASVANLVCQRELLTRLYRIRYEFDPENPIPDTLPVKVPANPNFQSPDDDDGEQCLGRLGTLPQLWLQTLERKFTVLDYHRLELASLFERFFDHQAIAAAVIEQTRGLAEIAANLGHDSGVKALCNDAVRKTLAPLAANKTLDASSFRDMLGQERRNFDGLTIDAGGDSFTVSGCSFRNTVFRNIELQLQGCALHHAHFEDAATLLQVQDCEFGKRARGLHIDRLRGDYSGTRFERSAIAIVFPGCRIDQLAECRIGEFGGQAKRVERCRIETLRGLLMQVRDTFVEKAVRARFGPVVQGLRCSEVSDCQFGSRVIEGVLSIKRYRGSAGSQSTFVKTAFGTIEAESNLFRLRECLIKQLRGQVGTLERCRVAEITSGAIVSKVTHSQIEQIGGGHVNLCGTHEERGSRPDQPTGAATHTVVKHVSGGEIAHLNGRIDRLSEGSVGRVGFEEVLRLSTLKQYITHWDGGQVGGLDKKAFLSTEKDTLREETQRVAQAIRSKVAQARQQTRNSSADTTTATEENRSVQQNNRIPETRIDPVKRF